MRSITREMVVLFEAGSWRICRTGYGDGSAIYHHCEGPFDTGYTLADEWWRDYRVDECVNCKAAIPAEIRGLYLLHTWDR